ncbi:tRNA (adenosine(37)-N6)-dimethylallyltransferase MiaA [Lapidilactobacillus salsurivasis]
MKEKVLAIVGPTAVGKTALSLDLAKKFNGEIISGDSLQVYRHLNIGTAKITAAEQGQVPHYLLDIRDVTASFSAYDFKMAAGQLITEISGRGHLPIIVGGTGMYLASLLKDFTLGAADGTVVDAQRQQQIRRRLAADWQALGSMAMWQRLAKVDPEAAASIPEKNRQRVLRALEVWQLTGQRFSAQPPLTSPYDAFVLGLNCQRPLLYQRINQRVEQMIAAGLEDEARWLFQQVDPEAQAAKGIGYREWPPYFQQQASLAATITAIQTDSRHYAKRQLTYFRHQFATHWFDLLEQPQSARQQIDTALAQWLRSPHQPEKNNASQK